MATNPRIPEPHDHARMHEEDSKKGHFPVPVLILIVAAALIAGLVWYFPRRVPTASPTNAAVPAQPTGGQIQLTNVRLANSPVGDQVYVDAILHNTGNTTINGVLVNLNFPGANGAAGTVQAPVMALTGADNAVAESLVNHPIEPGAQQPVRISVTTAPQGWNHQIPGLTVATVTAVSPEGGSAQPAQQPGVNVTGQAPNSANGSGQTR